MEAQPTNYWTRCKSREIKTYIGVYQDEALSVITAGGTNENKVPLYIVIYDNAYDSTDVKTELMTSAELLAKHGINIEEKEKEEEPTTEEIVGLLSFPKRPCKGPDSPTVQDVIDTFMKIKDKTLPVFGYISEFDGNEMSKDIIILDDIDISMDDRVDINMTLSE